MSRKIYVTDATEIAMDRIIDKFIETECKQHTKVTATPESKDGQPQPIPRLLRDGEKANWGESVSVNTILSQKAGYDTEIKFSDLKAGFKDKFKVALKDYIDNRSDKVNDELAKIAEDMTKSLASSFNAVACTFFKSKQVEDIITSVANEYAVEKYSGSSNNIGTKAI